MTDDQTPLNNEANPKITANAMIDTDNHINSSNQKNAEIRRKYGKPQFGLPEFGYDSVKTVIRGMAKLGPVGTQVSTPKVAELIQMSERVVTGCNRFILSTGIAVKSGQGVALTEKGGQLALALDYNDQDEVGRIWRSIVIENEFLKKILASLQIKDGMMGDDLAKQIAKMAGAPNEPQFIRGGKTVVEVLLQSKLIFESESGKLSISPEYGLLPPYQNNDQNIDITKTQATPVVNDNQIQPEIKKQESIGRTKDGGVQININISIILDKSTTDDDVVRITDQINKIKMGIL